MVAANEETARLFFSICRVDQEKREVWGVATTEEIGLDGKVMDFDASCRAFERWHDRHLYRAPDGTMVGGNIREQHSLKPVAAAIGWVPDTEKRLIYLGSRVSRGADDTWAKILDGTLRGYSINGPVHKAEMRAVVRDGRERRVPWATELDYDEISFVDRPGDKPALFTQIIRSKDAASQLVTDVVDDGELAAPTLEVLRAAPAFEGAKCPFCQGPAKDKGNEADCTCDEDCGADGCPKADGEKVTRAIQQDASSGNEPVSSDELQPSCPACTPDRSGIERAAEGNSDCTCEVDCGANGCTGDAASVTRAAPQHDAMVGEHTHEHAGYEANPSDPNAPHNHKHTHGIKTGPDGAPIPDANHEHDHADAHAVSRAEPLPSGVDYAQLRSAIPNMGLSKADEADMLEHVERAEAVEQELIQRAADVKTAERNELADKGHALPDGSYPIPDVSHLKAAIVLAQSGHGDVAAAKKLIIKRAGELNAEAELPDDWKPGAPSKVTRATSSDDELSQVKLAVQARDILKQLIASEAAELTDPDEGPTKGWDLESLAKALGALESFISSETYEAATAMRSAPPDEEEIDMGAAEDILAKLDQIQTTVGTVVERVEKLETGTEEQVTRSADVIRSELVAAQERVEQLAEEVKRIGDQPASSGRLAQPIRLGDAIPESKRWPGERPEELAQDEQVIRVASVLADEASDPLVRGRARMELVNLLMHDTPETAFGEVPARR